MHPLDEHLLLRRRHFLTSTANGVGALALGSMFHDDGLLAAPATSGDPMSPKRPQFAPQAKSCIFVFLAGAPSQIDLFDPKPKLVELHGQRPPDSLIKKVRFAFINKETTHLMGSPRRFTPHGECGMELSDYLPYTGTCADDIALVRSIHTGEFNHHPAQLMMNTGVGRFGRPSIGAWVTYGLGSESRELPGYVVLSAGVGSSGGTSNWSSGFLPSTYQGVMFRNQSEPVLNLNNPPGVTREMQRKELDAISRLNQEHLSHVNDPEISSRIASYELAFRMQIAAPDLLDLSRETEHTLKAYGVDRSTPKNNNEIRDFRADAHASFAKNCLLARRLVERGVRFINLYHASWDHHSNLNNDLKYYCDVTDQPLAALVKDLKQRGLLDSTLVVFSGEFGRTPLAQIPGKKHLRPGRDHHPHAFSLWMAGGGIQGGQVVGKTDELGWAPVEDPIHINDFHATLLHLFGLDHLKLTHRFGGLNLRLTDLAGKVVRKLLV